MLVQYGIDGAAHGLAVVNGDALFRINGDAKDEVGSLLDVLHVPEVVAQRLGRGGNDFAHLLGDAAACGPGTDGAIGLLFSGGLALFRHGISLLLQGIFAKSPEQNLRVAFLGNPLSSNSAIVH